MRVPVPETPDARQARARSRHGNRSAAARPTKLCATTVQLVHTVCPVTPRSVSELGFIRLVGFFYTSNGKPGNGPQNIHTHQPRLPTTQPPRQNSPAGLQPRKCDSRARYSARPLSVRSLKRQRGPFSDLLKSGHMGKGATQHVVETRKPKAIDVPPELVSWMNPIGSFSDELVRACAARSESP